MQPPPVKLGMIADFASVYSDAVGKGTASAIEMAIDDFAGSVLGCKIVLLQADHQNKPGIARTSRDNGSTTKSSMPSSKRKFLR